MPTKTKGSDVKFNDVIRVTAPGKIGAKDGESVEAFFERMRMRMDIGVARITCGSCSRTVAHDLQLSMTAAGLLGTLHLSDYLLGMLASPSLNAKVNVLALCRASHLVIACASPSDHQESDAGAGAS